MGSFPFFKKFYFLRRQLGNLRVERQIKMTALMALPVSAGFKLGTVNDR